MSIFENYTDVCRTCMKKEFGMKCIFNAEVNSVPVSQMLSFTTPLLVRPDDNLPNTLCSNCLQMLISFYKFQEMCIQSDQKFRCKPKASAPHKGVYFLNRHNVKIQSQQAPSSDNYMPKASVPPKVYFLNRHNLKIQTQQAKSSDSYMTKVSVPPKGVFSPNRHNVKIQTQQVPSSDNYMPKASVPTKGVSSLNCDNVKILSQQAPSSENYMPKASVPLKVVSSLNHNVKIQPQPAPSSDKLQLGWNSSVSCPFIEVSDDEEIVLKFEYDNEFSEPIEDYEESDNMSDEYEQFDKLPIIDVKFDGKNNKAENFNTSVEELNRNNNDNIPELHESRICGFKCDNKNLPHHVHDTQKNSSNILQKTNVPIKLAYICTICKIAFAGQDRLVMHKKTHEKQGLTKNELTPLNIKSYSLECKACKRFYNNRESYDRHSCVATATCSNNCSSKNSSCDENNFYTCNICKRMFKTWEELTKHINEHSIKILYGSNSSSNTTVNVNVNIQTDKTHDCGICKESFTSWDVFIAHCKQHSEDERKSNARTQGTGLTFSASSECEILAYEPASEKVINDSGDNTGYCVKKNSCKKCYRVFKSYDNLKCHMKNEHNNNETDSEDQENEEINTVDALRAYRICRLYECNICAKTFDRKVYLVKHKKTHLKKKGAMQKEKDEEDDNHTNKPSQCNMCGIFVSNEYNLRRHIKKIHEITEEQVEIEGKEINLSEDEDIYPCIVCEEEFLSRRALLQHLSKHKTKKQEENESEEKTDEMSVKVGEGEDEQKNITKRVTRSQGKLSVNKDGPLACCGETFKSQTLLDQHKIGHDVKSQKNNNGHRISVCRFCNRTFKSPYHFSQHMLSHKLGREKSKQAQSSKGGLSNVCSFCNKKFQFQSSQKRHLKRVHGLRPDKSNSKSGILYVCLICNKSFSHIRNLKNHKKCHEKWKKKAYKYGGEDLQKRSLSTYLSYVDPHKCLECKEVLTTRYSLKKHMCRKHQDRMIPFNSRKYVVQCVCSKPFDSKAKLYRHYWDHSVKKEMKREDKYGCHYCLLLRPHAWQIRRHMKDSHNVTNKELQSASWKLCKICKAHFINEEKLNLHMKKIHEK